MMCGILGNNMDALNGKCILTALRHLYQLSHRPPKDIYWGYIVSRADALGITICTSSDLAYVRALCLNRALTAQDAVRVRDAWAALADDDRAILTHALLADGINEKAFLLMYLPLYL